MLINDCPKIVIKKVFYAVSLIILSFCLQGAEYYVASTGDDITGNGSIGKPWQTISKGQSMLSPGDTLLIRGGTYYESVTITVEGTSDNPTTIKAYPGEEVVLDGKESVSGWVQCKENDPFLTINGSINPNYANIYWLDIHEQRLPKNLEDFTLFENNIHCRIARTPDQTYGYGYNVNEFRSITTETDGEKTRLIDSANLDYPDDYWAGAWIDMWLHGYNNIVIRRNIISSSQSEKSVVFDDPLYYALDTQGGSLPDAYSIVNHPHVLDTPGEFAHTKTADKDGYYRFFYWPFSSNNLDSDVTIATKTNGIWANAKNHLKIEDLYICGYTNRGINIRHDSGSSITDIIISNCIVEDCGGHGIYLENANSSTIEKCTITRVEGNGALITGPYGGGQYGTIKDCVITDTSGTNAVVFDMEYVKILNNKLNGSSGCHGNGVAIYYGCNKVLIAYNYFLKSNLALQDIEDVIVFSNTFNYLEQGTSFVTTWPDAHDTTEGLQLYINNTILGSSNNSSLCLYISYDSPHPENYVINNIIDGCSSWNVDKVIEMDNNLYTGLNWSQGSRYGWSLGDNEIDATGYQLDEIFTSPGIENGEDYTLKPGSPAIAKGKNIQTLLESSGVKDWFPNFDFTKDKAGNPWAATPSIGAYEYQGDQVAPGNTYTLTALASKCNIIKSPDKEAYEAGEVVTLTAERIKLDSMFMRWSANVDDPYSKTTTITMNKNEIVAAEYRDPVLEMEDAKVYDDLSDFYQVSTENMRADRGSIAMWVYPDQLIGERYIFGHTTDEEWSNRIQIYTLNEYLCLGLGDSHTTQMMITRLRPGLGYHLILMWNNGQYKFFVDGTEAASGIYQGLDTLSGFADVGNTGYPLSRAKAFDGTIDDVKIYNEAINLELARNLFYSIEASQSDNIFVELFEQDLLGQSISYSMDILGLPVRATFDAVNGLLNWRPWYDQTGTHEITVKAQDSDYSQTISITVEETMLQDWYTQWLEDNEVQTAMIEY